MATEAVVSRIPSTSSTTEPSSLGMVLPQGGNTGEIRIGVNELVRICAFTAVVIRFGPAGTNTVTIPTQATILPTDILLPANVVEVFDMGGNESIVIASPLGQGGLSVTILNRS
jgi:hypothetical protein